MPNSTNVFLTLKHAPPRIKVEGEDATKYDSFNNTITTWYPDGEITVRYCETGVFERYYPRPTLADVISFRYRCRGDYFRTHKDGTTEHGFRGQYYYWGPDEPVKFSMKGVWQNEYICCSFDSSDNEYDYYTDDDY